ncbi:MAG: quinoprotein dehydrogenase-associated SoxYZ-like carrier [Pseudomonadota bacterium]
MKAIIATLVATALLLPGAALAESKEDPLESVMWSSMAGILESVNEGKIVFDDAVSVVTPSVAENQMEVPVTVDATKVGPVEKIVVVTDFNPIHHVLTYEPIDAAPYISFRVKVEQATPVRAAVLTEDGTWHVGSALVDAAGGGCTAPALSHGQEDWVSHLTKVRAKIWRYAEDQDVRLRVKIRHPMDTGLADGIPAFFMSRLEVKSPDQKVLARLDIRQPVSEHPTFTLKPHLTRNAEYLQLQGRDTDGNLVDVKVPAPNATSSTALFH